MAAIHQIDVAELDRMQQEGPVTLLDVRTDAEVARGHLAGAIHIPLNLLPNRHAELPRDRQIAVYCQSGGRSAQACAWLGEHGYDRVHNLQGGLLAWLREGRTLVQP